jgi:hypothetical protein
LISKVGYSPTTTKVRRKRKTIVPIFKDKRDISHVKVEERKHQTVSHVQSRRKFEKFEHCEALYFTNTTTTTITTTTITTITTTTTTTNS